MSEKLGARFFYILMQYWKNRRLKNFANEEWRPVIDFDGYYEISNFGRVKRLQRSTPHFMGGVRVLKEMILKQNINSLGYIVIELTVNEKQIRTGVHRLVAFSFLKKDDDRNFVNHKNGIKWDNTLGNLEWCTHQENEIHARETGLKKTPFGEDCVHSILTNKTALEVYLSNGKYKEIGEKYGIVESEVCAIKRGRRWSHVTGQEYRRKELSDDAVIDIFTSKNSMRSLERKYSVSLTAIKNIKIGKTYSHITSFIKI